MWLIWDPKTRDPTDKGGGMNNKEGDPYLSSDLSHANLNKVLKLSRSITYIKARVIKLKHFNLKEERMR